MILQEARKWTGGRDKNESLDYSDGVRGASDGDSGAESINMQQKSLVDMEEGADSDNSEEVLSALPTVSKIVIYIPHAFTMAICCPSGASIALQSGR